MNIPAGVADGMKLSMSGKGNAPERGGIPGDLIILIEEIEDPLLKRDGNNIIFDLYLNFADAALGTQVEIPTVSGKVKLKIDAGTQAGKILRLRGKGLPELNSGYHGDQLVQVNVWTPKKFSPEEKETVKEQFKDLVKTMHSLAIFLLPGGALLLPLVLKVIPDLMPSAFRDNEVEK